MVVEVKSVKAFLRGDISIPQFDDYFANQAKSYQNKLTKPQGSLGRVEDFAIWMAGWQKKINPTMDNTHCLIYAGNHGVATQGVSAYPSDVTAQMVENFKMTSPDIFVLKHDSRKITYFWVVQVLVFRSGWFVLLPAEA